MKRKELIKELTIIRNKLYDNLPTGEINAFDLTTVIKLHLQELDLFIEFLASHPEPQQDPEADIPKHPNFTFKLNGIEYASLYRIIDAEYMKRFTNPEFNVVPQFYRLYVKGKTRDKEIGNTEKIDLANPDHIEFIMTDGHEPIGG